MIRWVFGAVVLLVAVLMALYFAGPIIALAGAAVAVLILRSARPEKGASQEEEQTPPEAGPP